MSTDVIVATCLGLAMAGAGAGRCLPAGGDGGGRSGGHGARRLRDWAGVTEPPNPSTGRQRVFEIRVDLL